MLKKIRKFVFNCFHPVIGEVWELHRVTDKHSDTDLQRTYEITPARLQSLISDYLEKGYMFISMNQVRKVICGEEKIASKFVAITLDDGYRDNYEVAYPLFKKNQIPFCIYLLQNEISGDVQGNYPMLTYDQIKEMDSDPLCTLGGHTYSHPRLSELKYEGQFREISQCQEWLEGLIKHHIIDFSYPFGSFNQDTIEILINLGIQQCTLAWGGKVRKGMNNVFLIPRRLITETTIQ